MAALLHDHCSISLSFKMICNFSLQKKNMGKTQQGPKIHLRWKVDIRNLFSVTVIQKLAFRNRFPSGVFQILEVLCYPLNISHLTGTRESEDWPLSKMNRNTGADLGGGCRGGGAGGPPPPPPPEMTCGFLIQLVFCWSRARDECTPS